MNYRTKELTQAAVASVLREPEVREVVVVDNASGDGSTSFLRSAFADPRVRVVENPRNGGFGYGANRGAAECTSPLLLILNSDATVRPGTVRLLAETLLADGSVGIVAPAVYADGEALEAGTFGRLPSSHQLVLGAWWAKLRDRTPGPSDLEPGWVSGVAMLLRRSDFSGVGQFDEAFTMYFEDIDLCRRLRDRGQRVRRQPAAAVLHAGGRSWRSSADKRRRFQESKAMYYERIGATPFELRCVRALGRLRTAAARLGEGWRQ